MTLRLVVLGIAIFAGMGLLLRQEKRIARPPLPPALADVLRRATAIQQPLRAACERAAADAARTPATPAERSAAIARLKGARATATAAEAAFRKLDVPAGIPNAEKVRKGLESSARMAALSGQAIDAAVARLEGRPGAEKRMSELQAAANQAAQRAAGLLQEAARVPSEVARPTRDLR